MSEQNQLEEKLNGDSVGNGPLSETRLQQITNDVRLLSLHVFHIHINV